MVVTGTNMVPTVCIIMSGDYSLSDIIIIIIIIIQVVITTARGCLTQIPHHNLGQLPGSPLSCNVKEQIMNYKSNFPGNLSSFAFLPVYHFTGVFALLRCDRPGAVKYIDN